MWIRTLGDGVEIDGDELLPGGRPSACRHQDQRTGQRVLAREVMVVEVLSPDFEFEGPHADLPIAVKWTERPQQLMDRATAILRAHW